jgi:hypothetical protein
MTTSVRAPARPRLRRGVPARVRYLDVTAAPTRRFRNTWAPGDNGGTLCGSFADRRLDVLDHLFCEKHPIRARVRSSNGVQLSPVAVAKELTQLPCTTVKQLRTRFEKRRSTPRVGPFMVVATTHDTSPSLAVPNLDRVLRAQSPVDWLREPPHLHNTRVWSLRDGVEQYAAGSRCERHEHNDHR